RAAAALAGPASPSGEAHARPVAPVPLAVSDFRLVQLPARGGVAAVLVAVGIADHHLLQAAPALEETAIFRNAEQPVHHADAVPKVGDRLEERHDIDRAPALRRYEARFLQQDREAQKIGDAARVGDDERADRSGADTFVRGAGRLQDPVLSGG